MSKKKRKDVDYGKPPKEHQFKKGKSGNPKGRPKAKTNLRDIVDQVFFTGQLRKINGKKVNITGFEASCLKLQERAFKGDLAAIRLLLNTTLRMHYQDYSQDED